MSKIRPKTREKKELKTKQKKTQKSIGTMKILLIRLLVSRINS